MFENKSQEFEEHFIIGLLTTIPRSVERVPPINGGMWCIMVH